MPAMRIAAAMPTEPAGATRGRLTVITGPMFAGKSARLIAEARKAGHEGAAIAVLKPIGCESVGAWPDLAWPTRLVFIDEAQFLTGANYRGDLIADIERALDAGLDVMVSGLDTDYHRTPFAVMAELAARADAHLHLAARCHRCGQPARWTAKRAETGRLLEVGDDELYEARCDVHWTEPSAACHGQ
jgi:thymidine kinase